MERSAIVAIVLLALLLGLSLLSRTMVGSSRLGAHAASAVKRSCERLCREAAQLRVASHQDGLAALALAHNCEALALVRAATALTQEYGLAPPPGAQDLTEDLRSEQEASVRELAAQLDEDGA